jgi:hypothetical protein
MLNKPSAPLHFIEVPTYENGIWYYTPFKTRDDFRTYLKGIFKEPGLYDFDETSFLFNEQAQKFNRDGFYCSAPYLSKDFRSYWDSEKEKCRRGAIYKANGKEWFLSRDYYMWLNFLPIYDKEEKAFGYAKVRDAQYHMALYETLAELHYKHAVILKKRQIASSYFHMGKLLNTYWFESGAVLKLGASLKDYINEKGSWKFLDEYKNFLNEHTAWYRPNDPDKVFAWRQRIKVTRGDRDTYDGLMSNFTGVSFEKNPTNGVGGPVTYFFHEEAGIAPKMDKTYGYIRPAMKSGMITTGMFIAAGSVGDLTQCEPLKLYVLNPDANDFYSVESNLIDKDGTIGRTGLFIPEQWSMPPYIDEFGNSVIYGPTPEQATWLLSQWIRDGFDPAEFDPTMGALKALEVYFAKCKKDLEPEAYQLEISQHPRNIEEAFAYRKESKFPQHLITRQLQRIEEGEFPFELLDIKPDADGKPCVKPSNKIPINEFPISKKTEDKEGVLVVYERPQEGATWGTYYGSIDPVGEGKTTTSESLCSIIIYKNEVQVTKDEGNGKISNYIEQGKIVATWCGRFDDLGKTHERLELIIEWYNAWTIVENNIALFIQYMILRNKQKYLVPKDQMIFLKEINSNTNVYADYGWKNTGSLFKGLLISYGIAYVSEEIEHETNEVGDILKTMFGVERIPDRMILKEMQAYYEGLNVDRLVTFCSLIAFVKTQTANRGILQKVEKTVYSEQKDADLYKWTPQGFVNIGKQHSRQSVQQSRYSGGNSAYNFKRSAFKNLR